MLLTQLVLTGFVFTKLSVHRVVLIIIIRKKEKRRSHPPMRWVHLPHFRDEETKPQGS